eukprot:scaffold47558_cov71-Phaeocystis_antarctica.AAC.3
MQKSLQPMRWLQTPLGTRHALTLSPTCCAPASGRAIRLGSGGAAELTSCGEDGLREDCARRGKVSKSPKPASITASRCSRSLGNKHRALPAPKVANSSISKPRASAWSSSGCAMR